MDYSLDLAGQRRLEGFVEDIRRVLKTPAQRESFATYFLGLLSDGERKSVEPMSSRACADPAEADAAHQRLLYFARRADWSDSDVRRVARQHALGAMTAHDRVAAWILDDTGFPKQGTHSVGVQRQYCGVLGKVANCQVGVSLTIATHSQHVPIDFELYLPESWTNNPERRREAQIPDDVKFKTKWQLALDELERAVEDGVPQAPVLGDSDYGDRAEFRRGVRCLGLDYAVGVHETTTVWQIDKLRRRVGRPIQVQAFARQLGRKAFRPTTWREGSKRALCSRFAMRRVVLAQDDGVDPSEREDVWLLIEWPAGEAAPTKYSVSTMPRTWSRKRLVQLVKERWRTERVYEELKGELGLDHYEGRRFRGWHHHVTVALCAFSFVVAEREGSFPPSRERRRQDRALAREAGTPLPRLVHHGAAGDRACACHLAAALPAMPSPTETASTAPA